MNITENGLHIVNGSSAAATWRHAYRLKSRLLFLQDELSCGPMPLCPSLSVWEETRMSYLRKIYLDWELFEFQGIELDLLHNANRLKDYDSIYIWASIGFEDQLFILFVVYLADVVGADTSKIKLVQFESSKGRYLYRRLGEVSPEQIRRHPTPVALTQSDIDNFRAAWLAVTSSNPIALQQFVSAGKPAFPYLLQAMRHLLRRYPQRKSGLLFWDLKLLENSRKLGPIAVRIVGHTLGYVDDGDCIHDEYLFYRLRELADKRNPEPLIKMEIYKKKGFFRVSKVTLTEFGQAVLAGSASSYPTNPIDEWIGGVHLSSEQRNLWFYENGRVEFAKND
jgi:hypothetical protein